MGNYYGHLFLYEILMNLSSIRIIMFSSVDENNVKPLYIV